MSLISEKMLTISIPLAATIGLEEAVLLQALNELLYHNEKESNDDYCWATVNIHQLQKITPFWDIKILQRLVYSLRDKGVLLVASSPLLESAKTLSQSWSPEKDVLRQLGQYNIPAQFISDQLPEFITYWSERNDPQFSWGSKFIKHVLRLWRNHQTESKKLDLQVRMSTDWMPSEDAMDILVRQAGINHNFIEDAIPEFMLYWAERGDASNTWNSRFVMHVKRQWAKFSATMEQDSDPRPIPRDWQPSEELYEVLVLANIPRDFAERLSPEFTLYWRESAQAHTSWNTKFLQQVKREWSRQQSASSQVTYNDNKQRSNRSNSTRGSSLIDELSDRSWASS